MQTVQSIPTAHTPLASNILEGPLAGDARVTGTLPDWLRGRLLRTAPAVFQHGAWQAHHWFDGLGMLYRVDFPGDGRVSWQQRLLECGYNRAVLAGETPSAGFATPTGRSLVRRAMQPIPDATDNTNVNIVPGGSDPDAPWLAMTESDHQLTIDPRTLTTRGAVTYTDDLPGTMGMTAHPHLDLEHGTVVNVGTILGARSSLVLYSHPRGGTHRTAIATVPLARVPYTHAFGLTRSTAVLIGHPFDVNPLAMLWSDAYITQFAWRPQAGTVFHRVDRATGTVAQHTADPMFVFHTVNTWHDGADTVLDLLAYPDASIVHALSAVTLQHGLPELLPTLTRVRLTPGVARATVTPLAAQGFEFPVVSYARVSGRSYRVVWGADIGGKNRPGRIVRTEVDTGRQQFLDTGSWVHGEPVYIPRPEGTAEDDGVLVTVGTDPARGVTRVLVLDAGSLASVAEATLEVPFPLGFHGSFQRASAGRAGTA